MEVSLLCHVIDLVVSIGITLEKHQVNLVGFGKLSIGH